MQTLPVLFPPVTENDWRRAAGREPAPLVTEDGITIPPLENRRVEGTAIDGRPGWRIVQRLTAADPDAALRQATSAIAGGANGIEIVFDTSAHPLRSRLPVAGARRLAAGLAGFGVPDITFRIDAGPATAEAAAPFAGIASSGSPLVLAYDPVAQFAATTDPGWPRLQSGPNVPQAIEAGARVARAGIVAIADGRIWSAAGATDTQELAAVLATLVAFLRAGSAADALGVALAADAVLFPTLAKFRAMRQLLRRLAELLDVPATIPIHGETAWRRVTHIEPRMNVLRGTIGTLAAVTGDADSLTVLPFDAGTESSNRLARNTQLIAKTEAGLDRVADPGAGAGAIETLTDALASAAWSSFQTIEADGGIAAPAALERLTQAVAGARQRRAERVANGDLALIGVNAHIAKDTSFGAGIVDYPRTLLRYEPLDGAFMEVE